MNFSTLSLLNKLSILVVEDCPMTMMAIKQGVKPYCKLFYEAKDGIEGLETFKKYHVDIILTDIHLPLMNGFEMIKEILSLKSDQLFIVMTSFDTNKNIMNSIKEGACSFLRKPLDIKDIQTALLFCSKKVKNKTKRITQNIVINFDTQTIYKNNELVFLSQKRHKIFWLLCLNIGRLVSYEMMEDYVYLGESVNKSALHTSILRIKQELGKDINIESISGKGYILQVNI